MQIFDHLPIGSTKSDYKNFYDYKDISDEQEYRKLVEKFQSFPDINRFNAYEGADGIYSLNHIVEQGEGKKMKLVTPHFVKRHFLEQAAIGNSIFDVSSKIF